MSERTVHAVLDLKTDLQLHVSTVVDEDASFTDIREYVVSLEQYGRGVTFPTALTPQLAAALAEVPS